MAHFEADALAEAWKAQTGEEWQTVPMQELDLESALLLINTVNTVLDRDLKVIHEMIDSDFVTEKGQDWTRFMRPVPASATNA